MDPAKIAAKAAAFPEMRYRTMLVVVHDRKSFPPAAAQQLAEQLGGSSTSTTSPMCSPAKMGPCSADMTGCSSESGSSPRPGKPAAS